MSLNGASLRTAITLVVMTSMTVALIGIASLLQMPPSTLAISSMWLIRQAKRFRLRCAGTRNGA